MLTHLLKLSFKSILGHHTVYRSKYPTKFNTVSTDMALEQTLNRESKIKGGIIGVAQDDVTVGKWTLASHLRSAVKSNVFSLPSKHLKELTLKKKNDTLKTNKMTADILKVMNVMKFKPVHYRCK